MPWMLPPFTIEAMLAVRAGQVQDWSIAFAGVPEAWKKTQGEGVKVAVVDTGSTDHPDLRDAIVAARDFTGSQFGHQDRNGHGTHCAGIVAARNNDLGTVGVAPKASILAAKVLGDNGSGSDQSVANGVLWAVQQKADVINLSLGSPQPSQQIKAAIDKAIAAGVYVVCAAGNSGPGPNTVDYPGKWPNVIGVASINQQRQISKFSSRGPEVDVCAPGERIASCWLNGGVSILSGTSMATPFVAGCLALMIASYKQASKPLPTSGQAVLDLLKGASDDVDKPGFDPNAGWGLVDPAKLLAAADETPTPPITPPSKTAIITVGGTGLVVTVNGKAVAL